MMSVSPNATAGVYTPPLAGILAASSRMEKADDTMQADVAL